MSSCLEPLNRGRGPHWREESSSCQEPREYASGMWSLKRKAGSRHLATVVTAQAPVAARLTCKARFKTFFLEPALQKTGMADILSSPLTVRHVTLKPL